MLLDGHIHIYNEGMDKAAFSSSLERGHIDGGIVISLAPRAFPLLSCPVSNRLRLENLMAWCDGCQWRFPFYWIDPMEPDAEIQVDDAVAAGVMGFKVICGHYYPSDRRAMKIFTRIASQGKPLLFHSGVLGDGQPMSSQYNTPLGFEALLSISGLRFALAHIAWPWCDELFGVYVKIASACAKQPERSVELFIDTTPGTPNRLFRRDALGKLLSLERNIGNRVFFGTDCHIEHYDPDWFERWHRMDADIVAEMGFPDALIQNMYGRNLLSFVGITEEA
jgi:predicted TIM-barrel fold metal-dependent hydrolase